MSLESTGSRCEQLARQIQVFGRVIPTAETVGKLNAVTPDDIQRAAARHFRVGADAGGAGPGRAGAESRHRLSRLWRPDQKIAATAASPSGVYNTLLAGADHCVGDGAPPADPPAPADPGLAPPALKRPILPSNCWKKFASVPGDGVVRETIETGSASSWVRVWMSCSTPWSLKVMTITR